MSSTDLTGSLTDLPEKARQLSRYLRAEAADHEIYVKATVISDDVGLSSKEIGAAILQLQRGSDLTIEKGRTAGRRPGGSRPSDSERL